MKNIPQKVRSIHETYGCPIYSLEEYCEQILHMKKSDLNNIEVCYQLPNFDDSFIAEDIENLNADKYCLVLDEYSSFLMPRVTDLQKIVTDKRKDTPCFYRVISVPREGCEPGLLCKNYTKISAAMNAGQNNLLDETGYFTIKRYDSVDVVIIGGEQDMGTVVYDSRFTFECNMDESYKDEKTDEWGCAYLWDKTGNRGVEYNFCVDAKTNYSAIYKMELNPETDYMDTDTSIHEHYEVDFDIPHWRDQLQEAMMKAYFSFFLEETKSQTQTQTM